MKGKNNMSKIKIEMCGDDKTIPKKKNPYIFYTCIYIARICLTKDQKVHFFKNKMLNTKLSLQLESILIQTSIVFLLNTETF